LPVAFADIDGAPVEVDLAARTAEDVAADATCP
jgi:hypothetical protein